MPSAEMYRDFVAWQKATSGVLGGHVSPPDADRQADVPCQLERLCMEINSLSGAWDRMLERLHPVLSNDSIKETSSATPEPSIVPLADAIRNECRRLRDIREAIERATLRVEV